MIVLIPAYEPAERLPRLVAALFAADRDRTADPLRVLVVDDGSGLSYAAVFARCAAAGAEVMHHERNAGKGAALKTGFRRVLAAYPGEAVVTADADGQHTVADILGVAEVLRGGDAVGAADGTADGTTAGAAARTMVLGCRAFDGAVPARSRFGNAVSRLLFRAAAGWRLSDTQTGLRGLPAAMLSWALEVPGDRFEYEQRALLHLRRAGFSAREVPIETVYLEHNASSHFRPLADSVRVMLPVLAFIASSLLGFVVDTVALFVFEALTGALVPSIVAARVLSAGVNFWMNRRLVFLQRGRHGLARQLVSYGLLAALLLASNVVWMSFLTDARVPLWCAKVVTELALFCIGYRVQRTSVFAPGRTGTSPGNGDDRVSGIPALSA